MKKILYFICIFLLSINLFSGLVRKQLAQSRPANTTAVSAFSPDSNTLVIVQTVVVCNTSGSASTFRIFIDNDGTTYDQTTALFYDIAIAADETIIIELGQDKDSGAYLTDSSGNLAVRTGNGNALTFTVYGIELKVG